MFKLIKIIFLGLAVVILMPVTVFAHIGYVVPEQELSQNTGFDFDFLFSVLHDPLNVGLILGTIFAVAMIYFVLKRSSLFMNRLVFLRNRTVSYLELTPWMMRLSLGIALIGAGTSQVLISPIIIHTAAFSFVQILLGFLLLAGFLLTPAIIFTILLFLMALAQNFYLLGNLDFLALAASLLILANPKPGLDDLLGIPPFSWLQSLKSLVPLILRIGIGGAMMFLAIYEKFLNPHFSQLVVDNYHLTSIIPVSPAMWVLSAGLIEFLVGLLLIIGLRTRLVAAIAFCVLTLSFFYFHETVFSHITLFGTLSVIFVTGGGKVSIDGWYSKNKL